MLANYRALSPRTPKNTFAPGVDLPELSRGMGGIGLPGDLSSQSRFVSAAFVRMHAQSEDSEQASVSQFYHILDAVAQQRGCCALEDGKFEITLYSSCCNADQGIYYYKTYENSALTAVSLFREDLEGRVPVSYALETELRVRWSN